MKKFALSLVLVFSFIVISTPKVEAAVIFAIAGKTQTARIMSGVGGGMVLSGGLIALITASLGGVIGGVMLFTAGGAVLVLDEKISIDQTKELIAHQLNFIDDEDTLEELSLMVAEQYEASLDYQYIKLDESRVRGILDDAGYLEAEADIAVESLSF